MICDLGDAVAYGGDTETQAQEPFIFIYDFKDCRAHFEASVSGSRLLQEDSPLVKNSERSRPPFCTTILISSAGRSTTSVEYHAQR